LQSGGGGSAEASSAARAGRSTGSDTNGDTASLDERDHNRAGTAADAARHSPRSYIQTFAYEPLGAGDSSMDLPDHRTATSSQMSAASSSEHATSTAWGDGASRRASGRGSLSVPPGTVVVVHQHPTGQSLSGFSDVASLL
jgi:hypothetical protein